MSRLRFWVLCFEKSVGGDLNRDGVVNFADLNLVLGNFVRGCH